MKLRPTAVVWMRGMLQHEYGVAPTEIHWRPSSARCAMASSTRFSRRGRRPRSCAASRISDAGLFPIMHLIGTFEDCVTWKIHSALLTSACAVALYPFFEIALLETGGVRGPQKDPLQMGIGGGPLDGQPMAFGLNAPIGGHRCER
jgi:hypothetical protein